MNSQGLQARQAIEQARAALRRGDRPEARRWAERAVALEAQMEDAWLILAAIASPRASVAYLQKALEINPASARARQGMAWAVRRLEQAGGSQLRGGEGRASPGARAGEARSGRRGRLYPLLLFSLACAALLAAAWTASGAPARAFISNETGESSAPYARAEVAKPTYTPSPTPTFTPSPTPTHTPTAAATPSPSATPTALPTSSPAPTWSAAPAEAERVDYIPPAAEGPAAQKYILVDISEQHLYAYQGEALIYSFVASTGMDNSTRVGTFRIQSKIPNAYGSTWDIWMPNWMGIYWSHGLENGIHALPILPSGARLWAGYLGRPISYGCVVLGSDEAQLLYDWAEIGTPVEIRW